MGDGIVKLELTLEEVNTVLYALAERPYKEVYQLIEKVQKQGNDQVPNQ